MEGPGRIFFLKPDTLIASVLWDFYQSMANFCGSYLQFGTDPVAINHTWYDTHTTKEFWCEMLDAAGARRPRQLGAWDGAQLQELGPGVAAGVGDLVVKLSDSYLGIGDRVITRGAGGLTAAAVQAQLGQDSEYAGKPAIANELVLPTTKFPVSSAGHSGGRREPNPRLPRCCRAEDRARERPGSTTRESSARRCAGVHSLDIITIRTRVGVRVLSVILWTDCSGWSSHSASAGHAPNWPTFAPAATFRSRAPPLNPPAPSLRLPRGRRDGDGRRTDGVVRALLREARQAALQRRPQDLASRRPGHLDGPCARAYRCQGGAGEALQARRHGLHH